MTSIGLEKNPEYLKIKNVYCLNISQIFINIKNEYLDMFFVEKCSSPKHKFHMYKTKYIIDLVNLMINCLNNIPEKVFPYNDNIKIIEIRLKFSLKVHIQR